MVHGTLLTEGSTSTSALDSCTVQEISMVDGRCILHCVLYMAMPHRSYLYIRQLVCANQASGVTFTGYVYLYGLIYWLISGLLYESASGLAWGPHYAYYFAFYFLTLLGRCTVHRTLLTKGSASASTLDSCMVQETSMADGSTSKVLQTCVLYSVLYTEMYFTLYCTRRCTSLCTVHGDATQVILVYKVASLR